VLKKALLGRAQIYKSDEHSHSPYREVFYYTEKGAKLMWDKVAARIEECGGTVRLDREVTGINHDRDMVRSVNVTHGGKQSRVYCDWTVSTIPVTSMVELLHPSADVELLEKVRSLKFRAMVLLYIVARKELATPYQWIYYSSDDIFFNRLSEFKNLTPAVVQPGQTVLCLETSCFEGDEVWNASEDEVYEQCMRSLESLNLIRRQDVETYFHLKLPYAYPIADLNYEENFPHITKSLKRYKNLLSAGRQGSFAYLNMDQSMEDGFRAALEVLSRKTESPVTSFSADPVRGQGDDTSGTNSS
jgi:protoporphyrinogen oxidase